MTQEQQTIISDMDLFVSEIEMYLELGDAHSYAESLRDLRNSVSLLEDALENEEEEPE